MLETFCTIISSGTPSSGTSFTQYIVWFLSSSKKLFTASTINNPSETWKLLHVFLYILHETQRQRFEYFVQFLITLKVFSVL